MNVRRFWVALFAAILFAGSPAQAQGEGNRSAVLDHLGRGTAAFRAGDSVTATEQWSEAIRLAHQIGDADLEGQALARRGEAYRIAGSLNDAGDDLRAALAEAEVSGDQPLIAAASGAMGNLELVLQHPDAAEKLLTRSLDLARRLGDRQMVASSSNDLGNLYLASGRLAQAARVYADADANAQAIGDPVLIATTEINSARLASQQGEPAVAALLTRAVVRLERAAPSYNGGLALITAGSLALERDGSRSAEMRKLAERAFRAAEANADALHNARLSSLAHGGLGHLDEHLGRVDEASRFTSQALFSAQQGAAPELSFRWNWQQARLAVQQGQYGEALTSYRRAVAALQSVRRDIPVQYQDGRSSYRVTFGPLYREFSDLLLRRATAEPMQAAALRIEARNTIEQLKESELQDYFRDSCIADFKSRRQSVETISPGAAVLYPIALPDRIELLVSFGQDQQQFTIPVSETALTGEVHKFRQLLEKRTTNEYLVPAQQLYDQLIRPIDPVLAAHHIDTLVVVPDTVLRVIPFAALHDGKNFLIERYATAVAPSLRLINPQPLAADPPVALVLGISQSVQGFVGLPEVLREVAAIHAIEGGKTLVDGAFTEMSFASELKSAPYNVVHIASHAAFDTDPTKTFVLAHNGELTMDDLETDIKLGQRRDSALELLVLSACETASGDDRAALGLAGVALKAGARSAVASLWYVSDQASEKLVVDFYRELHSGRLSKAQALQTAQRRLIGEQRYSHPAYWAPFLLIGNWL
jgi:CHAT domain-containing protein